MTPYIKASFLAGLVCRRFAARKGVPCCAKNCRILRISCSVRHTRRSTQHERRSLAIPFDPIQVEVWRHLFASTAEEMGATLERTGFSPNIKERRDHSCALFDAEGRL